MVYTTAKVIPSTKQAIAAIDEAGRYPLPNTGGLFLLARDGKTGLSKRWYQRFKVEGKQRVMTIGQWPQISVADAKRKAADNLQLRETVKLPTSKRGITLRQLANKYILDHRLAKRDRQYEKEWERCLGFMGEILDMQIPAIRPRHVLAVMMDRDEQSGEQLWTDKHVTATRVLSKINQLMDHAEAYEIIEHNPFRNLHKRLPKAGHEVRHLDAIPWSEVPAALLTIRESRFHPNTRHCLEWIMLTACRSRMAREMFWSELDLDNLIWNVPGRQMKNGKDYRAPITPQMLDLLRRIAGTDTFPAPISKLPATNTYVFPSRSGKPMAHDRTNNCLRKIGLKATTHGFRTSFREWCQESEVRWDAAEMQLSHLIGDRTERSYARSDLLDTRREIMEAWADYLTV